MNEMLNVEIDGTVIVATLSRTKMCTILLHVLVYIHVPDRGQSMLIWITIQKYMFLKVRYVTNENHNRYLVLLYT